MSAMTTYMGHHFDPLNPDPDLIDIRDIAHALSNVCRYAGHADMFYSVAQHSVLMSQHCTPRLRKVCLLHDAAEAYLGDMVRPMKHDTAIGGLFEEAEQALLGVIFDKFEAQFEWLPAIEFWDRFMLRWEQRDIRPRTVVADGWWFNEAQGGVTPDAWINPWSPILAKTLFIEEFDLLFSREEVAA